MQDQISEFNKIFITVYKEKELLQALRLMFMVKIYTYDGHVCVLEELSCTLTVLVTKADSITRTVYAFLMSKLHILRRIYSPERITAS